MPILPRAWITNVIVLGLTACTLVPPEASPTAPAPIPTETVAGQVTATDAGPEPTQAPPTEALPSATPTPEPSQTPAATPTPAASPTVAGPATPDPQEGVGDVIYAEAFDGASRWNWAYDDETARFELNPGERQLQAQAKQRGSWRFTVGPSSWQAGDMQLTVTARAIGCAESDMYGVLFRGRSNEDDTVYDFYNLVFRCDGQARLERLTTPNTSVLVDWADYEAIGGVGVDNRITIWARGDQLRFYANDQYLFSAADAGLSSGFVGFYLADRNNGNMTVVWRGLQVRAVGP
jgi:hypothetical protein